MQNVISPTAEIIERLKKVLGLTNDADLARVLGVPPKKLAVWKLRDTIPLPELTSFCSQRGYDLMWALTGKGGAQKVAEGGEVYARIESMTPIEKRKRMLTAKLSRIVDENDEKKMKALEAQLDLLDPGIKKPCRSNESHVRTAIKNNND